MPHIFMAFVTERPLFFALHAYVCLRGMLLPQTQVRICKILYSRNRIVQFGEYFQVQI